MPLMDSLVDWAWLRKESELEATAIGTTKAEKQKEKKNLGEKQQIIQELWDNCKRCNVHVMGTAEERKEQKHYLKQ